MIKSRFLKQIYFPVRPNIYILAGTIFLILTWLFVGLFRDDEFYEPMLFTKYRPTFKVMFYTPIGMQDLEIKDLPADKQPEEIAFQEFVIKQNIQNNAGARLWYLPFTLIQLTLTFMTFGVSRSKRNSVYEIWQPLTHFFICIALTTIGLAFILAFDHILLTAFLGLAILAVNYLTLVLVTRQIKN
jgi:hypothetical protein